jgi:hypothetical protein
MGFDDRKKSDSLVVFCVHEGPQLFLIFDGPDVTVLNASGRGVGTYGIENSLVHNTGRVQNPL